MLFEINFNKQKDISFDLFQFYLTGEKVLSVEQNGPNTIIELKETWLIIECFSCQGDDCCNYREQIK